MLNGLAGRPFLRKLIRFYGDSLGGFVPSYLELLAAGGSKWPEELAAIVGCDLADPGFWSAGLDIVDAQIARAEAAAVDAGRVEA